MVSLTCEGRGERCSQRAQTAAVALEEDRITLCLMELWGVGAFRRALRGLLSRYVQLNELMISCGASELCRTAGRWGKGVGPLAPGRLAILRWCRAHADWLSAIQCFNRSCV
jgi:hypothetical protein